MARLIYASPVDADFRALDDAILGIKHALDHADPREAEAIFNRVRGAVTDITEIEAKALLLSEKD